MRRLLLTVPAALAVALPLAACSSSSSTSSSSTSATAQGQGSSAPFRVLVTGGLSAPGVPAANSETSVLAAKAGGQFGHS